MTAAQQRGVDGLTDSERLMLKVLSEIHNRLGEEVAAVKENTGVLREILVETKDSKARQRIQERTPPPKVKPTCNRCGTEIMWPKDYVRGSHAPPNNLDGTQHQCGGRVT